MLIVFKLEFTNNTQDYIHNLKKFFLIKGGGINPPLLLKNI